MPAMIESSHAQKEKKKFNNKEQHMCYNVLYILRFGTELQPSTIKTLYNHNMPIEGGKRPMRSLETKWETIKYDVVKFINI